MLDDIDYSDRAYQNHMRKASECLRICIVRARLGEPTRAPQGLAVSASSCVPAKGWQPCEVGSLRELRDDGRTIDEIAEALGRSRESVKDAIRRHLRGFDRRGNLIELERNA